MNRENILKVADYLENCVKDSEFDMDDCYQCIGGYTNIMNNIEDPIMKDAADYLDLDIVKHFFNHDYCEEISNRGLFFARSSSRQAAIICLRNLVATGRVNWKLADAGVKLYDDGTLDEAVEHIAESTVEAEKV